MARSSNRSVGSSIGVFNTSATGLHPTGGTGRRGADKPQSRRGRNRNHARSGDNALNEPSAILTAHGGRIDAAARLYPAAPQPWIDLSTGINPQPYPVPPLDPALWQRLPLASDLDRLVAAAAGYYGQPEGLDLLPVPGSESAIRLLPRLVRAHRVGILGPTYSSHAAAWSATGSRIAELDALPDPAADLDGVVVVNPNNPDGRRIPAAELAEWAAAWTAAGHWLVVDEAFADVDPEVSLLALPALPPRIVVLRSLGKFFGLAGLRLGFLACSERVTARWQPLAGDWPVSGPAAAIGTAALGDAAWIAGTRRRLAADRQRLDAVLAEAGLAVVGGTDLFALAEAPERPAGDAGLVDHFARRGILVRGFAATPRRVRFGLPGDEASWRRLRQACVELT
jgi:cobalamin biosynthetic protein CobC